MIRRPDTADSVVYGIHAVCALLERRPAAVREVWLERGTRNPRLEGVRVLSERGGVTLRAVTPEALERRVPGARHQGVLARVNPAALVLSEQELKGMLETLGAEPLLLVLDGVQDPRNLGACLRSADAAGVDAVIAPRDRAAGLTPAACKVASGAVGRLPFVQVSNLARTLRHLRGRGLWIIGLDTAGERTLYEVDLRGPLALVLGAEGRGMRRLTREHCDLLARIPMAGAVESLNISVAAGIALFEAGRQRRSSGGG